MLFKEINAVYPENYMKYLKQNVDLLIAKEFGIYSSQWALKS
jgi:hypothetical protein